MKKHVNEIEKYKVFQELFPIDEKTKDRIKHDMSENGFDENQPIVLAKWPGMDNEVCVDGHTRVQVAEELGIDEIPTVTYAVKDEQQAFDMALKRQVNRRNLTDAEILQCVETISTRYGNPPNGGLYNSVEEMSIKLGISKRKTERTLRVMENAPPEIKRQVKEGAKSIYWADQGMKSSPKAQSLMSAERKKPRQGSRMVEIDADQWEQLERISELTDAEVEDIVYEALEEYLTPRETDEQASEQEIEETEAA
jgi:hypothetical protein